MNSGVGLTAVKRLPFPIDSFEFYLQNRSKLLLDDCSFPPRAVFNLSKIPGWTCLALKISIISF